VTPVQRRLGRKAQALSIIAATSVFALAGCSSFKESIGAAKQMPDETAVATRAPLVVPATFDLKPPQPGAPRPQDSDAAAAAQRVLGGAPRSTPASEGEKALLSASGAQKADASVRQELGAEVRESRKRKSYADTVLFWRGNKVEVGTPLDASEEAQRVSVPVSQNKLPGQQEPVIVREDPAAPAEEAKPETKPEEVEEESGGWFDWF
jgi:hypothetical protein